MFQEKNDALNTFVQQVNEIQHTFDRQLHRIRNDVATRSKSRSVSNRFASRKNGGGKKHADVKNKLCFIITYFYGVRVLLFKILSYYNVWCYLSCYHVCQEYYSAPLQKSCEKPIPPP